MNPYSPPQAEVETFLEEGVVSRKGDLIAVPREGRLPAICATCGAAEGVEQLRTRLKSGAFILVWRNPLVLLPQCDRCSRRGKTATRLEFTAQFLFFCVAVSTWLDSLPLTVLIVVASAALVSVADRMMPLRVVKLDARRIWIKGVHVAAAAAYCGEARVPTQANTDMSRDW